MQPIPDSEKSKSHERMEIEKITGDKDRFMELLLLGDEQESMIRRYLGRGELFALYDTGLKTVCVVTREEGNICEIKNIATRETEQGKGYATTMINHVIENCRDKCDTLLVGTGDNEEILSFYRRRGFVYSHTVKDFFVDNYDHQIVENGRQLRDMVYLKMDLSKQ